MSSSAITENTAKRLGRNIVKLKYDKNENCSLCLKEMKNTKVQFTLCGHIFHNHCLEQQYKSNYKHKKKCSLCREELVELNKIIKEFDFNKRFDNLKNEILKIYEAIYNLYVKIRYADDDANNENEQFICDMNKKINIMNEKRDKLDKLCKDLFKGVIASEAEAAEADSETKEYNETFITTNSENNIDIEKAIKQIEETHEFIITLQKDVTLYTSNIFSTDGFDTLKYNNNYYEKIELITYNIFVDDCDAKEEEIRDGPIDYPYIYVMNVQ